MAIHSGCHMIGVMGSKGGVGKSIFAANFAIAIQNELKANTLLIDLDSKTCGDQNIILGLRPEKNISDLCNSKSALTPLSFKTFITTHASGVDYLASVTDPSVNPSIDEDMFLKSLQTFSQYYKYIVVDLGNQFTPLQYRILDEVSSGLMIATPDILTVTQTKKMLNEMLTATYPAEIFQIVINKAHSSGLNPKTIGESLKRPVLSVIPQDDTLVYTSLSNGTPFTYSNPRHPVALAHNEVIRKLTGGVLQKLKSISMSSSSRKAESTPVAQSANASGVKKISEHLQLKIQIHGELLKDQDLKKDLGNTKGDPEKERLLELKAQKIITKLIDQYATGLNRDVRAQTIKEILDESLKLGPLEELLADNSISEIMVNGCEKIFVEKSGKVVLSPTRFTSNLQLRNIIERIVTPLGRRIDDKTPYVDARLADGSRVNAVIEPLSIDGPALTIRKFSKDEITADNYLGWGSMSRSMVDFLKICVEQGLNIVISGGTGSGKTTLLNTLSGFIPSNERIVTIEDAAELQLKQEHVVRLETRPAGMDGANAITIRDLVKNSLRMRPDRIVVGECRDGAALDMLQAMNTGHDGSMTTVHANNAKEAIGRLETLCLMAGMDLPARAIKEQIASAVNLIVQIGRLSDGTRKVKSITEVVGMQGEVVTLTDIFKFKDDGYDKKTKKIVGAFQSTGLVPTFIEKFEARGVHIPRTIFSNEKQPEVPNIKQGLMAARKKFPLPKASGEE